MSTTCLILFNYIDYPFFFFLMIRRPPRSTLFPTRRSSDLEAFARSVRDLPAQSGGAASSGPNPEEILAGISDGLIALDNEWRVAYVNKAAQLMWRRDVREAIGKTIHEVLDIGADNPFHAVYAAS